MDEIKICADCTHAEEYRSNPDVFAEALGRFATCGFKCTGPHKEAIDDNPFVPTPRSQKMCGLDYKLKQAIEAAGLQDTADNNVARLSFFDGMLEFHPIEPKTPLQQV